jgi:hypothetical protein
MTTKATNPQDELFIPDDDDGWTLPGYFAAVANAYPEIRFTYRPYTPPERARVLQGLTRAQSEREVAQMTSQALSQRIKTWNLTYRTKTGERKPAPITPALLNRLRFALWDRLAAVVIYQTAHSDTDPTWSAEDKGLFDDASFKALIDGGTQAERVAETLEGN